jgi:hypothetical protein
MLKAMIAAAVLACGLIPITALTAQSYSYRLPPGSFNPSTIRRQPVIIAPGAFNRTGFSGPATMGPTSGPIGSSIGVQLAQNLTARPALLSFKAVVSRGIPARVHTVLSGGGLNYATVAPIQLCIQGGGTWEAELVLSNGQNLGVIGSYTPTNCPR